MAEEEKPSLSRALLFEFVRFFLLIAASVKAYANFQNSIQNLPHLEPNEHCLMASNALDREICTKDRATAYVWIYMDGAPRIAAHPLLTYLEDDTMRFRIMNGDALESSPILESYITGKMSRNYLGAL